MIFLNNYVTTKYRSIQAKMFLPVFNPEAGAEQVGDLVQEVQVEDLRIEDDPDDVLGLFSVWNQEWNCFIMFHPRQWKKKYKRVSL